MLGIALGYSAFRQARHCTNAFQIGVSEQVGTPRPQPSPQRRKRRGADAGPNDQKMLIQMRGFHRRALLLFGAYVR